MIRHVEPTIEALTHRIKRLISRSTTDRLPDLGSFVGAMMMENALARRISRLLTVSLMSLVLCQPIGCSEKDGGKPKIRRKEGRAKQVDVENRKVSMVWIDNKGDEQTLEGTFTDKTEVLINGRSQTIKDVRPGDRVEVYGYSEGEGTNRKLIATKVVVNRPKNSDWKSTGQGKGQSPPGKKSD